MKLFCAPVFLISVQIKQCVGCEVDWETPFIRLLPTGPTRMVNYHDQFSLPSELNSFKLFIFVHNMYLKVSVRVMFPSFYTWGSPMVSSIWHWLVKDIVWWLEIGSGTLATFIIRFITLFSSDKSHESLLPMHSVSPRWRVWYQGQFKFSSR